MRFIEGLLMALADSIPGVSGGTVAFLLGFYDKLVHSLRHIISKDFKARQKALRFLLWLGTGWAAGMVLAVLLLDGAIERHVYAVSSVFLGFVLTSIPAIAWKERHCLAANWHAWPMGIIGFSAVFLTTKFSTGNIVELNLSRMTLANGLILFVAVAAAASAMILPGISGSSLLMAFGLYLPVISRLSALLHGDISALSTVAVFGAGAIVGLGAFVRLLNRALARFRAQTMYAVTGMMIASLYAVAVGPATLKNPQDILSLANWRPECFVIGCLVIVGFTISEKALSERKKALQTEEK